MSKWHQVTLIPLALADPYPPFHLSDILPHFHHILHLKCDSVVYSCQHIIKYQLLGCYQSQLTQALHSQT